MSFTDPDYTAGILQAVLDLLATALDDADRPVARTFRSPGVPSWDCGQLAVWSQARSMGPETNTDRKAITKQARHGLDINILLTRCLTSTASGMPTAEQVDADGEGYATDQWIIQRALYSAARDSTFLPGGCMVARLNPVTPASPQGGYSGMTTTLEVALG